LQKPNAAKREERILSCPRCPGKLGSFSFMEFILDRCEVCDGIWLYEGKLEELLRKAARGPLGAFFGRCFSLR
jgi:Zn-finger nucleic acid-binding protein